MNRNGVLASMCFPSMPGFSGRRFQEAEDKDLALVMLQAYNDWHIDEWCASHPGRFIPLAIGPTWDMDAMVAEIHRVAAKGCRAISMPELPHIQGLPTYQSDYWDPFFARRLRRGHGHVPPHRAWASTPSTWGPTCRMDNFMVLATQVSVLAVQDLLWGPAMRKYPDLKVAFSEGGIGWIPFLLDRVDRHYLNQRWTGQDFGAKLPSEVFREHSLACFISDPTSLKLYARDRDRHHRLRDRLPALRLAVARRPRGPPRAVQRRRPVRRRHRQDQLGNAARFCDYDPFAVIPRAEATVGALRAQAADVDTSIVSRAEWRARYEANPTYEIAGT